MKVSPILTREEWLAERRKRVQASDIPNLLGVGYLSPLEVWAEKLGKIEPTEETIGMKVGTALEPVIAKELERAVGYPVSPEDKYRMISSGQYGATLDAVVTADPFRYPAEFKTVMHHHDRWTEEQPDIAAYLQLQWQLMLTEAPYGYIAALLLPSSNGPLHYRIDADLDLHVKLRLVADQFLERLASNTPPPVTDSEGAWQTIQALYPRSVPKTVELPEEAASIMDCYQAAKELEKHWSEQADQSKAKLGELMGDAEVGIVRGAQRAWSWKSQSRKEHVVKASTFRVAREVKWDERYERLLPPVTEGA